jgi:hypothetical protein
MMLLSDEELKRVSSDDRRGYENSSPELKQQWADNLRAALAKGTEPRRGIGSTHDANGKAGHWLMIVGVILILIGFFYNVGVGGEFDRVVNIAKMGEKFAFIFIGLGSLITGAIFWNADRIVKATEAR